MGARAIYFVFGSALLAMVGCQAILGLDEGTKREGGQGGSSGSGGAGGGCDPGGCPAPVSACQAAVCDAQGACGFENRPARTECSEGGGSLCDGQGACVECVDATDCTGGDVCSGGACVPASCTDGVLNGSETETDCGGSRCPFCPVVLLLGGGGNALAGGRFSSVLGWNTVSLTAATSDRPAVAISAAGEGAGLVHFMGGGAIDDDLVAASWNATDGWSQFSTLGVNIQSAPAISTGIDGIRAAHQSTGDDHYYAELNNGTWAPVAEGVGNGAGQSFGPSAPALAIRGTDAIIAFVNGQGGTNHLFARRRIGGSWQTGEDIAPDPEPTIAPEIVTLPGSGDLLVTFVRVTDHQILATRWNGVAWEFAAPVAGASTDERPALAALTGDEAVLAFRGTDGMAYTSRYNGTLWSAPAGISTPNVAVVAAPAVTHGVAGAEIELVYVTSQSTAFHTRFMGGAWTAPTSIVTTSGLTRVAIASGP